MINNMKKNGFSLETISKIVNMSEKEIKEILNKK